MDAIKRIAIVGCGWLGTPLALSLVNKGYEVRGTRQQSEDLAELNRLGITAESLVLSPELECPCPERVFAGADLLLINIPPRRKQHDGRYHQAQIAALLEAARSYQIPHVLFISSTSVYGSDQGRVDEQTECVPTTDSGKTLVAIEQQLLAQYPGSSVLRFAGLIGPKRHPGRFLSGRCVDGADSPVNLIHQQDCIRLIETLIERNIWGEIWNGCCDSHPSRAEFYRAAAAQLNLPAPQFSEKSGPSKIINNQKIKQELSFSFKFPDPVEWIRLQEQI